ncbi:MAG: GlsB/YeaQ/YmgE family stress response membrane protein [Sphingomonadales bacterium]|nr:GlsB/YeaQ/YmgE family stress response membrane protein [Sphingomonadales bacterium]
MLNVIGALISGFFIGTLAKWLYPGSIPLGWWMTCLLGIGGSLLAGMVVAASSRRGINDGLNRAGCLASVLGAMALIFLGRNLDLHW